MSIHVESSPQPANGPHHDGPTPVVTTSAAPPKASRLFVLLSVVAVVALGVWLSQRTTVTLAKQKELDAERVASAATARAAQLNPDQKNTVEAARIIQATPATWSPTVRIEGTLGLLREADVGFMASGKLQEVRVKVGDVVKKGQTLAVLDTATVQAQLKAAEAQTRAVETQLMLATDSATRTKALAEKGAAPESQLVQVEGQTRLAQAQLDASRAQVSLTQVMLDNHILTAPFSGVITRAPSTTGSVVGPGAPLFRLVDPAVMKFNGTVAPEDAALIKVGSPVEVYVQNRILPGKVTAVLPTVDMLTRRVPVEIQATQDSGSPVYAGTLVKAVVKSPVDLPVLRLPAEALRRGSQDEVMVVEGNRLAARRITHVRAEDGSLLVRSGVGEADRVLLNPPTEAKAGDTVNVPKVTP
jgi:RND family efflux transporter MFP subunit